MAKKPRSPEEILQPFLDDLTGVFGSDIVSVYLFGSAASGEYDAERSDINFLVVLTEEAMERFEQAAPLVKKWAKRGVAVPLFLTRDYIESSLDSFPIEFLNIKLAHRHLYGQDFIPDLNIEKDALRLKCEEQVKSKLLHLRNGVLTAWDDARNMEIFLAMTVPTFLSLFRVLLALNDQEPPKESKAVFQETAELYQLDEGVFDRLLQLRSKSRKFTFSEIHALAKDLIAQINYLAEFVDQWKTLE